MEPSTLAGYLTLGEITLFNARAAPYFSGDRTIRCTSSPSLTKCLAFRVTNPTAQVRGAPAELRSGYRRLMGCGHNAFRPKTAFAADGRLLIQDGNRLDWFTLGR